MNRIQLLLGHNSKPSMELGHQSQQMQKVLQSNPLLSFLADRGAIFVRPIVLPTSNAPISLNLATITTHKEKKSPNPRPVSLLHIGYMDDLNKIV